MAATSTRYHSLKGRLTLVTALVLVVFLVSVSAALEHSFRKSLAEAKKRELQLHVYTLLAVAESDGDGLLFPPVLPEPRFNQPDTGLLGVVTDASGRIVWQSASVLSTNGLPSKPVAQGQEVFRTEAIDEAPFSSFRQGVAWGLEDEDLYTFSVLEDAAPLTAQVREFRETIWRWLGIAGLLLVLTQWLVMRWGLAPLDRLAHALRDIQQGSSERLEGDLPRELHLLTDNLNLLIENERRQREKTRHTLDDLAHSLKTPLAVLKTLEIPEATATQQVLDEQVQRMDGIIRYQLQRAVASSPKSILRGVPVCPQLEKILSALAKVYRDRSAEVDTECDDAALFYGDEGDLMELLGNLLDNAYKYGDGQIRVRVVATSGQYRLRMVVADNGPGISQQHWEQVTQRGVRADQQQPGQGIGLAVVVDIVENYGGDITVARAKEGGAEIRIAL